MIIKSVYKLYKTYVVSHFHKVIF